MNIISLFYTYFDNPLEQSLYSAYLKSLSPELRGMNIRYVRWQDRHSHLFGKLLLIEALKKYGIDKNIWNYIEYNEFSRPYLKIGGLDFNISHSGNYVICAVGDNIRLGIDIEENRNVNIENFKAVLSDSQWCEVKNAQNPLKTFYKYWTIKESVIKADGRGFAIPLDKLKVENNMVQYDYKAWFVQELEFSHGYSAALATNQTSAFQMQYINFYNN